MKVLTDEFQDHLDSGATTLCWCWKLVDNKDNVFGFTDHDMSVSFGGVEFEAATGFSATQIDSSLGLAVDNLDVAGALVSSALNEDDLAAGLFDDAQVEIYRVNWQDTQQHVLMRKGNLGEVSRSQNAFTAEIRGIAHKLNQPAGRLFQHGCDADVGDTRCGVDLSDSIFTGNGTVSQVQDSRYFLVSGLEAFTEGRFERGYLHWLDGLNQDLSMEVKAHIEMSEGILVELWQPMPRDVSVGDGFEIFAGCDKQFSTCCQKFANGVNFRGFPHMPGNDFAISYPNREDANNDGSSRNS